MNWKLRNRRGKQILIPQFKWIKGSTGKKGYLIIVITIMKKECKTKKGSNQPDDG